MSYLIAWLSIARKLACGSFSSSPIGFPVEKFATLGRLNAH
jgi:hypothetical protein